MKNEILYNKYLEGRHWELHPTMYAEEFCTFLKEHDFHDVIVDLGCCTGRDVSVFVKHGLQAVGIDYAEFDITTARTRYTECKFEMMNIEQLSFSDESIGACFMINVMHYVDQEKALQEIFRCLKPGGFLFVHYNLRIEDGEGNIDYQQDENSISRTINVFNLRRRKEFERQDTIPKIHTHKILELILQKPE